MHLKEGEGSYLLLLVFSLTVLFLVFSYASMEKRISKVEADLQEIKSSLTATCNEIERILLEHYTTKEIMPMISLRPSEGD